MKPALKRLVLVAVIAALAAPLAAAPKEKKKKDKKGSALPPQAKALDAAVDKLDLSGEQKEQYQKIYQQHAPALQANFQQQQSIFTPEQKKKRREAVQKAKDEGLKGKEFRQFVQSAVPLTPEQQKLQTDAQTEILKTQSKFRQEVVQILTPEQKEKLPPIGGKKGKGKEMSRQR